MHPVRADTNGKFSETIVRSGSEIDYPPFCLVNEQGRADGFSVELMRAALAAMGKKVTFRTGTWEAVKSWLKDGAVRVLPLVGRTPEREAYFDFTFPYMSLHGAIVVRDDTADIQELTDLKEKMVLVMAGDNAEEFLRRKERGIVIRTTPTFQDALRRLSGGEGDAVVIQRLVALRLIKQTGLVNLKVVPRPVAGFRQDFSFAVKEGDRDMLALLNEGLALVIADGTYRRLHAKWFAALELPSSRRIVIGGDNNYPPFEYLDEDGRPAGFNVDLTRAMAHEVGLDVEIRLGPWAQVRQALAGGEIDAVQGMLYSPERDREFDFTPPHTVNHYVAVTRKQDGAPPTKLDELKGKRLVVQRGDIMHDFAVENKLGPVTVVDVQEQALRELVRGKHDCALVSRLTALYWIKKNDWQNLSVGREPLLSPGYCYAVPQNHKALLAQLGEGLRVLDETGEYRRIYEKWMGGYDTGVVDFDTIIRYVGIAIFPPLLLLVAFWIWNRSLRNQVEIRTTELREREEKYRLLAENTLDVIWTMDLELVFTYVNPASFALTGFTPEEWIGTRFQEHCDEKNFAAIAKVIGDELSRGKRGSGVIFEAEMLTRDGSTVQVEIHGKVIYDENGRPVRLQGTARDITERRRSENALRDKDRLLREMGAIAKVGGWEFDPRTGAGTWTEEVARIHDMDPEEKTSVEKGIDFYHGESRVQIETAVRQAVESGKPYDLELEMITAKGTHKWVRTIGKPKTDSGRVVQVRGSIQDITEIKHAQQRIQHLNNVLRAIRDVDQLIVHEQEPGNLIREASRLLVGNRGYASALFILTDPDNTPVAWAEAGMESAFVPLAERLGRGQLPPCCACITDGDAVAFIEDRNAVCGGCAIADAYSDRDALCMRLIHDSNSLGYLIVSMERGFDTTQEEMALIANMAADVAYALNVMQLKKARDASERKSELLEKQLAQAQKLESIGRLAGGVAHDYNNMISVISGFTELAMEKAGDNRQLREDLEEVLQAARRSTDITRQLLAFARRQTVNPVVLDLNASVDGMLKMLRRLIGEDIDLAWRPSSGVLPVEIDPSQIDQILVNLCVNARDAIENVGNLTLETGEVVFGESDWAGYAGFVPGDYAMLAVSDDGSGMDKQTLEKIFEPFFTTKGLAQGTGLGLSTVYGIVKQNNGFINVYSEPGSGTTFRIYLPIIKGEMKENEGVGKTADAPGRGETVLLVEDEIAFLKFVRTFLEEMGYAVLDAALPGRALELARSHAGPIDMLLTDVVMPEMNGRELADQIQILHPGIKCLYMSGYTADAIAHRGVLEKGIAFIQKPFSRKELAVKIRTVLDGGKG